VRAAACRVPTGRTGGPGWVVHSPPPRPRAARPRARVRPQGRAPAGRGGRRRRRRALADLHAPAAVGRGRDDEGRLRRSCPRACSALCPAPMPARRARPHLAGRGRARALPSPPRLGSSRSVSSESLLNPARDDPLRARPCRGAGEAERRRCLQEGRWAARDHPGHAAELGRAALHRHGRRARRDDGRGRPESFHSLLQVDVHPAQGASKGGVFSRNHASIGSASCPRTGLTQVKSSPAASAAAISACIAGPRSTASTSPGTCATTTW
jgi:hypothetical protein